MKNAEKKSSKKEYEAPQMDVIAFDVQGTLLNCSGGDDSCGFVEVEGNG